MSERMSPEQIAELDVLAPWVAALTHRVAVVSAGLLTASTAVVAVCAVIVLLKEPQLHALTESGDEPVALKQVAEPLRSRLLDRPEAQQALQKSKEVLRER